MRLLASTAFVFLMACQGARIQPGSADLAADHVEAARKAEEGAPQATDDLSEVEAKVLALLTEWDEKLGRPERLPLIRDFAAEPLAGLREQARSADFAATLAEPLTEALVLAAAFERNPRIRAAQLKLRSTVNQYAQVTYLDTILRQYSSFQRSSRTKVGMPLPGDSVETQFPFPGALELKAAIVGHAVEEAQARHAGVVRDVVVEVRVAFAQYAYLGHALRISSAMLAYLDQLEDVARGKLSAGTGPKGAVIQVQVEMSDLRNELITLEREIEIARARIARLVDVPLDTTIGDPEESALPGLPEGADALEALSQSHQPNLLAARARVARMKTMIELAEKSAYPPFSPGLSTMEGISHATGGSEKEREPFSTRPKTKPAPWFGSKEAYLREAREAARAADARVEAVENRTRFSVRDAYVKLETASRLHALYRNEQLAQAEQAYRDASAGYASDRVEFLNVIDTLRRWLRFQIKAHAAARDVSQSHAELEGAVGAAVPPEK